MFVVHLALTPLAGSPIRIVGALNQHTAIKAHLIVLNANAYGNRTFVGGTDWQTHQEEAREVLRDADIVHLHHFFELDHNPFNINLAQECGRARFVHQFHTHPMTIAHGNATRARYIIESAMPQLVVGQYHERFYPRARLVPNVVPIEDQLYKPVRRTWSDPVVFFAPTVDYPAVSVESERTRWDTKGSRETQALLCRVVNICGKGCVRVQNNLSHDQCLREKQSSDIAIDEMVTGSFHLTSLEALAQGLPTFAYLDARCLEALAELTGTHLHPWLNFRLEEAEKPLIELIMDAELRREMGAFAREWMEKYYNDREMVNHYVRAYKDLLERPEVFQESRFDARSRRQVFLAQIRDDLVWETRKERIASYSGAATVSADNSHALRRPKTGPVPDWIKMPVHDLLKKYTSVRADEVRSVEKRLEATERVLAFVAESEENRWLYRNRFERMDATLPVFDEQRRGFHLDRYRFAAERVGGKRVLDCACGTGYGARLLRETGAAVHVVGIDIERKAILHALRRHQVGFTGFICASGESLPLGDNSFDVVTSFETIEHVPDDVALVEEFYRVLRADGTLIISTPNQWPLADTPHHVREYDRGSFLNVLEARFDRLELYNQNSGSDTPLNHGQTRGIVPTTDNNEQLAECYIAVCRRKAAR